MLLGFALCAITPALAYGELKLINVVVAAHEQNKGLEKLLIGSLFNIVPAIQKIFTGFRSTNEDALRIYTAMGFGAKS